MTQTAFYTFDKLQALEASHAELLAAGEAALKGLIAYHAELTQCSALELTGGSVVGDSAAQKANLIAFQIENLREAVTKAHEVQP